MTRHITHKKCKRTENANKTTRRKTTWHYSSDNAKINLSDNADEKTDNGEETNSSDSADETNSSDNADDRNLTDSFRMSSIIETNSSDSSASSSRSDDSSTSSAEIAITVCAVFLNICEREAKNHRTRISWEKHSTILVHEK